MVPPERVVMQFFILLLFIINGLHSYPRHQPSLDNLNELIGQDANSPLFVVVDSNNMARTLNDERYLGKMKRKGRHVNYPDHHAAKFSEGKYENALYELLRASERMPKWQEYSRNNEKGQLKPLFLKSVAVFVAKQAAKRITEVVVQAVLSTLGKEFGVQDTTKSVKEVLSILQKSSK